MTSKLIARITEFNLIIKELNKGFNPSSIHRCIRALERGHVNEIIKGVAESIYSIYSFIGQPDIVDLKEDMPLTVEGVVLEMKLTIKLDYDKNNLSYLYELLIVLANMYSFNFTKAINFMMDSKLTLFCNKDVAKAAMEPWLSLSDNLKPFFVKPSYIKTTLGCIIYDESSGLLMGSPNYKPMISEQWESCLY